MNRLLAIIALAAFTPAFALGGGYCHNTGHGIYRGNFYQGFHGFYAGGGHGYAPARESYAVPTPAQRYAAEMANALEAKAIHDRDHELMLKVNAAVAKQIQPEQFTSPAPVQALDAGKAQGCINCHSKPDAKPYYPDVKAIRLDFDRTNEAVASGKMPPNQPFDAEGVMQWRIDVFKIEEGK